MSTTTTDPYAKYRTTDLAALHDGGVFAHGRVRHIHEVGGYSIVECHPWAADGSGADDTTLAFWGYFGNRAFDRSWPTIDEAMMGVVVCKLISNIKDTGSK